MFVIRISQAFIIKVKGRRKLSKASIQRIKREVERDGEDWQLKVLPIIKEDYFVDLICAFSNHSGISNSPIA